MPVTYNVSMPLGEGDNSMTIMHMPLTQSLSTWILRKRTIFAIDFTLINVSNRVRVSHFVENHIL